MESKVEPKYYFAALIAIVMVAAIAILSKSPAPTEPIDVELDYYYDTDDYIEDYEIFKELKVNENNR